MKPKTHCVFVCLLLFLTFKCDVLWDSLNSVSSPRSAHKSNPCYTCWQSITHPQQTASPRLRVRWFWRWALICSIPWLPWAPPAAADRIRSPSPPYRSATPRSGCPESSRSARTAPAWQWPASPHPGRDTNSGGMFRKTRAYPSASPSASRAWRIPHTRQPRSAETPEPRSSLCMSDWMPCWWNRYKYHFQMGGGQTKMSQNNSLSRVGREMSISIQSSPWLSLLCRVTCQWNKTVTRIGNTG